MDKDYITTKDQCAKQISGVCSGCGGQIEPIETIDNGHNPTYWPGCKTCMCFDYGVSEKIYKAARKLVEERHMNPYNIHIESTDNDETKAYKKSRMIRSVSSVIKEVLWAMENVE